MDHLQFGTHIGSKSWLNFQVHGSMIKVTMSEKVLMLVILKSFIPDHYFQI